MTNNNAKIYKNYGTFITKNEEDANSFVMEKMVEILENDRNGVGLYFVKVDLEVPGKAIWECSTYKPVLIVDNTANYLLINKEILSQEVVDKVSSIIDCLGKPVGIPWHKRFTDQTSFNSVRRLVDRMEVSSDPSDKNYACRKEGFSLKSRNAYHPKDELIRAHFAREDYDYKIHGDIDADEFPRFIPYLKYNNGVCIWYPNQIYAMNENREIIDWPE